jgi:transposase-like protein
MLPAIRSVGGRPSLLTDAKIQAIAQHIEKGNFAVTACALEDIAERTFYSWLETARQDDRAGKDTIHTKFMQSIKKASAIAESANVQDALAGGPSWVCHMTWLERRFPDRWGHQSKLSMEEARTFVHRVIGALAMHIADREVLEKIVHEVSGVQVEKHERISTT